MKVHTLLIACGFWVAAITGCAQYGSGPTESRGRQLGESTPNAVWDGDLLTFSDPRVGYQIDLPSDWAITVKNITIPNSYDTGVILSSAGCTHLEALADPGQTCVAIQVFVITTDVASPAEFERIVIMPPEYSMRSTTGTKSDREDLHGVPVQWYLLRFNYTDPEFVYAKALFGKNAVGFRGYGDIDEVRSVLQTVRQTGVNQP